MLPNNKQTQSMYNNKVLGYPMHSLHTRTQLTKLLKFLKEHIFMQNFVAKSIQRVYKILGKFFN